MIGENGWKMSENVCAPEEPTKCHALPAMPTKVDYIRIPRCLFWFKRTLGWPLRYVKHKFSVYVEEGRLLSSEIYLTQANAEMFQKTKCLLQYALHFLKHHTSPRLASPLSFIFFTSLFRLLLSVFFFFFFNWNNVSQILYQLSKGNHVLQ